MAWPPLEIHDRLLNTFTKLCHLASSHKALLSGQSNVPGNEVGSGVGQ